MSNSYSLNLSMAEKGSQAQSSYINTSGDYIGVITRAEKKSASTGTVYIELDFESNSSGNANYIKMFLRSSKGDTMRGEEILNALMVCLNLKEITFSAGKVEYFDKNSGKKELRDAVLINELMNKPIGLLLQVEEYLTRANRIGNNFSIVMPFEAATRKTALEYLNQNPASTLDKVIPSICDKKLKPHPPESVYDKDSFFLENQPEKKANNFDDLDDDIPF